MIELLLFWLESGGPIVVLLALLSIVSVALIAIKIVQVVPASAGRSDRAAALEAWSAGATDKALNQVSAGRTPADRIVAKAMRSFSERREPAVVREELEHSGREELDALGSYLRLLEIIAMIAPLLGLLGTVLGMIESFRSLELARGAANASVLAGGVWQALLTTAMGLIVAIPAATAAGLISAQIDRIGRDIESAVARLFAAEHRRVDE